MSGGEGVSEGWCGVLVEGGCEVWWLDEFVDSDTAFSMVKGVTWGGEWC